MNNSLVYHLQEGLRKSLTRVKEETRFLFQKFTAFDFICANLTLALLLVSGLVFVSGIGIVGYQSFMWLKDGLWTALPLMALFEFLFENTALYQWMSHPGSWLGLHELIEWNLMHVPLSLVLIVDGVVVFAGTLAVMFLAILVRRFQFKFREQ